MAKKVNLDIAQTLNITCRRGDTFSLVITLKDSNGTGLTLDTSKYQFIMQVRNSAFNDGPDGLILCTALGQPANSNPLGFIEQMGPDNVDNNGNVTVKISDLVMREIPSGRYVYDLQYVLPGAGANDSDTHTTILKGSFVVNEDVSEFAESRTEDPIKEDPVRSRTR